MGDKIPAKNYVFLSLEEATTSPGGLVNHIKDSWWTCDMEGRLAWYNPVGRNGRRVQRGLGSPQCNRSEEISRKVAASTAGFEHQVVFVPSVFVKINPADYV